MPRVVAFPLRALLTSIRVFGSGLGGLFSRTRASSESVTLLELRISLARAEQQIAWLAARLARVAPRHRPHYTPAERWRLLECRALYGLNRDENAQRALVCVDTIARWERGVATNDPEGALARPTAPVRRFADGVRALIQLMDRCGVGGNALIARTLLRAGWRMSAETVRRIRRERPIVTPSPTRAHGLVATRPNHVWLIDVTTIRSLFGAVSIHLALVLDAFSRCPLAWQLSMTSPTARQMARLIRRAIQGAGSPKHDLISDRGRPFAAKRFRRHLQRRGIRHRVGAVGRHGSIVLIERLWRTLKGTLNIHVRPPIGLAALRSEVPRKISAGVAPFNDAGSTRPSPSSFLIPIARPRHAARAAVSARSGCDAAAPDNPLVRDDAPA